MYKLFNNATFCDWLSFLAVSVQRNKNHVSRNNKFFATLGPWCIKYFKTK